MKDSKNKTKRPRGKTVALLAMLVVSFLYSAGCAEDRVRTLFDQFNPGFGPLL